MKRGVFVLSGFGSVLLSHSVSNRLFVATVVKPLRIGDKELVATRFCGSIQIDFFVFFVIIIIIINSALV